ncbi:arginase [Rodentibacter trehalosifermentans]|nr:arginase [Rodentibacter trehalosifermentans]
MFPQWQGAGFNIMPILVPELNYQDACQGYAIGSQLLNWLAPQTNSPTATVPVSMSFDEADNVTENGIQAYQTVKRQLKLALETIETHRPDRIVTLGGECSVSVPPFAYLAKKYEDDVAVIWLDAHRDLTVPSDNYNGYHAMALAKLLGVGYEQMLALLPATLEPKNALIVGLRTEDEASERQKTLGIASLNPEQVADNSQAVIDWLKATGKRKVMVHFDLDVLEPTELLTAVGRDPNGLRIAQAVRIINDIANAADLVGLTIAECMPREVIKLKKMLAALPLMR